MSEPSTSTSHKRPCPETPDKVKRRRGELPKEKHRKQRYRPEWESNPMFKQWLRPVKGDVYKASCLACQTNFTSELVVIKNHAKSKPHERNASAIGGNKTITQCLTVNKEKEIFHNNVRSAEIRTSALLAEKNIPFKSVSAIVARDQECFSDSKIAQAMKLSRQKATAIVKYVVGKCENDTLTEKLRTKKFSIVIDESTDIGTIKNLSICVRFADDGRIVTKFWRLVQVFSSSDFEAANEGATANRLFNELVKTFDSAEIPKENVTGFASDGCNTMFGSINSVSQRLSANYPGLTLSKCICHSLHLCCSEACKEIPRAPEELAREIYNYFKSSSKRQAKFAEFQKFFDLDVHKILRPSQTRWLSLEAVVERILEQWSALFSFFVSEQTASKLASVTNIVKMMSDPTTKMYFLFLQWMLPKCVGLNRLFQSDGGLIATVHEAMSTTYKEILSSFMEQKHLNITDLDKINPADARHFVPLDQMYLGASLINLESEQTIKHRSDLKDLLKHFRTRCRMFLIKLSQEMRDRFDFSNNSPYAKMQCLHRRIAMSRQDQRRPASLVHLVKSVPRIVDQENAKLIQKIDDQWRKMTQRDFPTSYNDMTNDEFWGTLSNLKNLHDEHEFKELGNFALDVLALPFSNAACERIFSKVNLIKTKLRNKLQTETINGLILTSQHVIAGGGSSVFDVTPYMLSLMTKDMYKKKKHQPDQKADGPVWSQTEDPSDSDEDIFFSDSD